MQIQRVIERVAAEPRPLKFLAGVFLKRSGLGRVFTVRRNGYRLRFYPTSLSAAYWVNPKERLEDEVALEGLLTPGGIFVDVGANIGALTLRAAAIVGTQGQVHSFEPHPRIFEYLRRNVALNSAGQVQTYCCALGETNGAIEFSDRRADDMNQVVSSGGVSVPVKRLDDMLPKSGLAITLLKIDAEGFELPVLHGAKETLKRTRAVYFEAWEQQYRAFGYGTADVIRFLRQQNFMAYRREGQQWLALSDAYTAEHCENLLALPKGHAPGFVSQAP